MGFRDKMKKSKQDLSKRHKEATNEGQRNFGSIFITEKIPKGIGFWSPRIGDNSFDVIPFFAGSQHPTVKKDELHFMVRLWVYQNSCNNGIPYVAPFDNWNKPDPIKEYMIARGRLPEDEFKKVAAKDRCVFLIWPHNTSEEEAKGIHIYESSFSWSYEKMKEESEMPMGGGHIPFADPDKGKTFYFKLEKSGSYKDARGVEREGRKISHCKFLDRKEPIPESILDQTFPLDEAIKMHVPYEELYIAFHGKKPPKEGYTSYPSASSHNEEYENPMEDDVPHETEQETEDSERGGDEEERTEQNTRQVRRPPITRKSKQEQSEDGDTGSGHTDEGNQCPYGHVFGVDLEKYPDDCGTCAKWDECNKEEDRLMSEKKAEKPKVKSEKPKEKPQQKRRPVVRRKQSA